jgi:hypothetical protein
MCRRTTPSPWRRSSTPASAPDPSSIDLGARFWRVAGVIERSAQTGRARSRGAQDSRKKRAPDRRSCRPMPPRVSTTGRPDTFHGQTSGAAVARTGRAASPSPFGLSIQDRGRRDGGRGRPAAMPRAAGGVSSAAGGISVGPGRRPPSVPHFGLFARERARGNRGQSVRFVPTPSQEEIDSEQARPAHRSEGDGRRAGLGPRWAQR